MPNYYYYGRRAFPYILIGVVVTLVLAIGGVVLLMAVKSWNDDVKETRLLLEERQLAARRAMDGTSGDTAMRAVESYAKNRGAKDAKEIFHRELGAAKFTRLQRMHLLERLDAKASLDEMEKMVEWYRMTGLNSRIDQEEKLLELFKGFISGSDKLEELQSSVGKGMRDVAPEIQMLLSEESPLPAKYPMSQGAETVLKEMTAESVNYKGKIDDLCAEVGKSLQTVLENFLKRIRTFVELKDSVFAKRDLYAGTLWENMGAQKKQWDEYLNKTRSSIASKRMQSETLLDKESEKRRLGKILDARLAESDRWKPTADLVDGKVLSADSKLGIAVIDIGREQGLRPGQGFDVIRTKGKALQEKKGRLLVREIRDHISLCKVVGEDPLNPISVGDSVANNPVEDRPFNRKDKPKYVIRGSFGAHPSQRLVLAMIESAGGVIVDKLNELANFLIVGDGVKSEDIQQCRELGIRVIRASDLSQHIGISEGEMRSLDEQAWKYR